MEWSVAAAHFGAVLPKYFFLLLLLCSFRFVLLLNYITSCLWFNWLLAFTPWGSKTRVRWMGSVSPVPFVLSKDTVISEMKLVYASRSSLHPTLALMMVGLGSKMPCIFLKAGMTKRLQVTTADTGFPRTSTGTEGQRDKEGKAHEKTALQ